MRSASTWDWSGLGRSPPASSATSERRRRSTVRASRRPQPGRLFLLVTSACTAARNTAQREKTGRRRRISLPLSTTLKGATMRVQNAQLWIHDQGEALDFYVGKLGWEVRSDATMPELGGFRWLTVTPPSQPDFAVVLMAIPGPPVMDSDTADQVRSLMAKGFAGT